jgi:hypothetical protein
MVDSSEKVKFQALNGQDLAVLGHSRVAYSISDSHNTTRAGIDNFAIGDISGFDMIVGMPWLEKWNPLPNFSTKTLRFNNGRKKFQKIAMESPVQFANTARDSSNACYAMYATTLGKSRAEGDRLPEAYRGRYEEAFSEEMASVLADHGPHEMRIDIVEGKKVPFGPLYSLSAPEAEVLRNYIEEYLARGWIRPSRSEAGAPILFAKKKDGGLRLCVDYRGLNTVTVKNRYPLPLIQESLERLGSAKIYSKLDLKEAYHRIRIKSGDEWKTAFRTRYGLYEYTVMPFGLTNAPAIFQSYINSVLSDLLDICCIVYLDDILIYSNSEEEHVRHVQTVLERLIEVKLYAKLSKCEFHTREVGYLGFIVTPEGVHMEKDRVKSIEEWPEPASVRDVRIFLGFANYYRRFIKGFSRVAAPLHLLTQRPEGSARGGHQQRKEESVPITLSNEAKESFRKLKDSFTRGPLLVHFNPQLKTKVETDASGFAISGILSQPRLDSHGKTQWHPVAFYSRKMSQAEKNYDTHDGELLAIVEAFKHWRHYLEGAVESVELLTDHANLQGFMTTKVLTRRQARWAEWLASFEFSITHRPGKTNPADGPSRRPDYESEGADRPDGTDSSQQRLLSQLLQKLALVKPRSGRSTPGEAKLAATTHIAAPGVLDTQEAVSQDKFDTPLLNKISECMVGDKTASTVNEHRLKTAGERPGWVEKWGLIKGNLLQFGDSLYVPEGARIEVMQHCHDDPLAGHYGFARTLELVQREFWWPGIRQFVKDYVLTCQACARVKPTRHAKHGELNSLPIPTRIWEDITMDMITDLPESRLRDRDYNCIMVVMCRLSKMAHYIPVTKKMKAPELAEVFRREIIRLHGVPKSIVTDRGSLFTSAYWSTFAYCLGTKRRLSTAFHPQTDGQTERQNQTLEAYLRVFCNYEQDNWAQLLSEAEYSYNNSVHSTTQVSPFQAVYGQDMPVTGVRQELDLKGQTPRAITDVARLAQTRATMKEAMKKAQDYQAKSYNLKHLAIDFKVGDTVYLDARNLTSTRPKKKLDYKYWGPYKIQARIGKQAYKLDLPEGFQMHPVFHVSLLEKSEPKELMERQQDPPKAIIPQSGNDIYEIDRIKGRVKNNGVWLYEVKWKGYGNDENQWLPAEDISKSAMRAFKARQGITESEEERPRARGRGRPPKRGG